ncbi:hypothetical protein EV384_2016 [Micromonospora kangleipakensis]|uniref:Uncharacterized protein n=1 Tax=Micromonospora kangleipakensis TaxID=1077942 RepID=A0A4Q8B7F7_9ACTN|nr:hypothetical protein EV384_2016 [Micromonospora kangleipakensis]
MIAHCAARLDSHTGPKVVVFGEVPYAAIGMAKRLTT